MDSTTVAAGYVRYQYYQLPDGIELSMNSLKMPHWHQESATLQEKPMMEPARIEALLVNQMEAQNSVDCSKYFEEEEAAAEIDFAIVAAAE